MTLATFPTLTPNTNALIQWWDISVLAPSVTPIPDWRYQGKNITAIWWWISPWTPVNNFYPATGLLCYWANAWTAVCTLNVTLWTVLDWTDIYFIMWVWVFPRSTASWARSVSHLIVSKYDTVSWSTTTYNSGDLVSNDIWTSQRFSWTESAVLLKNWNVINFRSTYTNTVRWTDSYISFDLSSDTFSWLNTTSLLNTLWDYGNWSNNPTIIWITVWRQWSQWNLWIPAWTTVTNSVLFWWHTYSSWAEWISVWLNDRHRALKLWALKS